MSLALAGLAAVLALQTLTWIVSVRRRDASFADVCWGAGFVLLAWLYLSASPRPTIRAWLAAALVTLWGIRLATHIFRRNHGRGEDPRYQAMRARHGGAFWWRSLFVVFWLQGALQWLVALPLLVAIAAAHPPGLVWIDVAGAVVFTVGFAFEALGDRQLERFKADPANRGRVLDSGLWHYTRHPNYFGDATLWWGLYLLAVATPGGWLTIVGPALMTFLLMRVSGVPLLEQGLRASRPEYASYCARTPAFFPWWPQTPPSTPRNH